MTSADQIDDEVATKATGAPTGAKRAGLVAAGGVLGAFAASSCCIAPLVLFGLGVSGAWISNLTALAPYQPIFVAVTLGFLGYGYYLVFWKARQARAESTTCVRALPNKTVKVALWGATLLVIAAIAFPYVAPLLLST